jgi:hypothetical protein
MGTQLEPLMGRLDVDRQSYQSLEDEIEVLRRQHS